MLQPSIFFFKIQIIKVCEKQIVFFLTVSLRSFLFSSCQLSVFLTATTNKTTTEKVRVEFTYRTLSRLNGFLCTCAQVFTELTWNNFSDRAGGTLNFRSYWLKILFITN